MQKRRRKIKISKKEGKKRDKTSNKKNTWKTRQDIFSFQEKMFLDMLYRYVCVYVCQFQVCIVVLHGHGIRRKQTDTRTYMINTLTPLSAGFDEQRKTVVLSAMLKIKISSTQ